MSWNEIERLEKNWVSPKNEKFDTSWEPLLDRGLKPYEGDAPVLKDTFPNDTNDERLLSDECLSMGRAIWNGAPNSSGHFHCYPIPTSGNTTAWDEWHRHVNCPSGKDFWWCSNVESAAKHYSWKCFSGGSFEQLALALQRAMIAGDDLNAAVVCLKILDWGGVRYGKKAESTIAWIQYAFTHKCLISDLIKATRTLRANSSESFDIFGIKPNEIPMTSGTTKLFAATGLDFSSGYTEPKLDVLILDGRVGAAMGLLARMIGKGSIPEHVRFPWGYEHHRNPSCGCIRFPKIDNRLSHSKRAEYTRNGAKVIQEILGVSRPSSTFIKAEKALFMIGYDVQNTCDVVCSAPRLCCHCMHVHVPKVPVSTGGAKKAPTARETPQSLNKKERAKAIFIEEKSSGLDRRRVMERFIKEADLTENGASTYYSNFNNQKWNDEVS